MYFAWHLRLVHSLRSNLTPNALEPRLNRLYYINIPPSSTQECCKEDEILESLLDSISSLIQTLDSPEEPGGSKAATAPMTEITLPAPVSLLEQFNTRTVFYMGDGEDDRLNTGFWLGPPGIDDGDIEPEMVCRFREVFHHYLLFRKCIMALTCLKPLDPFGTENKKEKFIDLQITYRV